MEKEKLIALLRNPQKHLKKQVSTGKKRSLASTVQNSSIFVVSMGVLFLVLLSLIFIFYAQHKAENIPSYIDKKVLKGLMVDRTFNPSENKRYIQVPEGAERVIGLRLGSVLPVLSRYNYRTFGEENYKLVGAAPWALSINLASNADDPELIRQLLSQESLSQAFLARADVAPLLEDHVALARLANNEKALQKFFNEEAAQKILASEQLVKEFAGSRFMAHLLISKSAKYYRDHPEAAAQLVRSSPTLSELKKNPAVRKAVSENHYLKKIAPTLLR